MLHLLPVELVLVVFEQAARAFVYDNRSWVVQLALVSRAAHAAVRPVLFERVIITRHNVARFEEEWLLARVLPFVRRLSVFDIEGTGRLDATVPRGLSRVLESWTPSCVDNNAGTGSVVAGAFIEVPWAHLGKVTRRLANQQCYALRGVDVKFQRLVTAFAGGGPSDRVPDDISRHLTRVSGYLPTTWKLDRDSQQVITPREWAQALAGALPRLTHLGLLMVDYEEDWDEQPPWHEENMTNYIELARQAFIALREYATTASICVRVGGEFLRATEDIVRMVDAIADPKLRVWFDPRKIASWQMEERCLIEDARRGRDIWSGPPPPDQRALPQSDLDFL